MSRYFRAKVTNNLQLNNKTNLLSVEPLESIINPAPGQFFMIEVGNSYDPLLKRPFSYFRKTPGGIQFLYTVKGRGTSLMRDFELGRIINIIGPLGNEYPNPEKGYIPLLIVGGIGIASIFPFVEALSKKASVLYGARTKNELFVLDKLTALSKELIISTDDGSMGEKGTIVEIVEKFLSQILNLKSQILLYACGPKPMLEALSKIAIDNGIKGYVSLEENMACGFGACLGCAVKVKSQKSNPPSPPFTKGGRGGITKSIFTYKRVCKEGPVFPIEKIVW